MASAWGLSWGNSWGNSWGLFRPREVGSSISAGQFSRGRWRSIQELERERKRKLEAAKRKRLRDEREEEQRLAAAARSALLAKRQAHESARLQEFSGLQLQNAQSLGAAEIAQTAMQANAAAQFARQQAIRRALDEEEAEIVMMLAME